jgi:hypothetical protein
VRVGLVRPTVERDVARIGRRPAGCGGRIEPLFSRNQASRRYTRGYGQSVIVQHASVVANRHRNGRPSWRGRLVLCFGGVDATSNSTKTTTVKDCTVYIFFSLANNVPVHFSVVAIKSQQSIDDGPFVVDDGPFVVVVGGVVVVVGVGVGVVGIATNLPVPPLPFLAGLARSSSPAVHSSASDDLAPPPVGEQAAPTGRLSVVRCHPWHPARRGLRRLVGLGWAWLSGEDNTNNRRRRDVATRRNE